MKKIVTLLEENVQWFALGLGVLYVLWMTWTYVLQSPVTVPIDNQALAPKDVDRYIASSVAEDLRARIADPREPSRISSPRWVQTFKEQMSYSGQVAVALNMLRRDLTQKLDFRADPMKFETPPEVWVEALPKVPAAVLDAARTGMSHVSIAGPLVQSDASVGAAGTEAAVQPVAAQETGRDIIWVTQLYRIPTPALAAAFREVKVPAELFKSTVLEVNLERQEVFSDGSYGPTKLIRPLPTVALQPLPSPAASVAVKTAFLQWANSNPGPILQPPFYPVLAGDAWSAPGQEAVAVVPPTEQPRAPEAFDPSKYVDATHSELMQLTLEQRRAVAEYKAKKAEEERKAKSSGRPGGAGGKGGLGGGGGGGMGGKGGGPFGPNDGGRGAADGEGGFIDPGSFEGRPPSPEQRGALLPPPANPQQPAANLPPPPGEFDPSQVPEIVGWAHDDTVGPGKTYRYRISYKIKSPVWNTANVAKPTELANTFVLVSEPSDWSQPISVPTLTSFFVLRSALGGSSATVQVFRWHGGFVRMKNFDVSPGDAIGMKEGDVDFYTGWTMVDMRPDPRTDDRYVVVMDPDGRLHTRDFRTDTNSPERKRKEAEAATAAARGLGGREAVAGTR